MNEKLSKRTMVEITRGARMELKVQAALVAKTIPEYLEELINQKKNERILGKSINKLPKGNRVGEKTS